MGKRCKVIYPWGVMLFLFVSFGCEMNYGGLAAKTETIDSWSLTRPADPSGTALTKISKAFETSEFLGEIEFAGSDAAINQILGGEWEIGFSTASNESVLLAEKTKKGSTSVETRQNEIVSFKILVAPKNPAKATNFGGSLSAGNTVWMQKDMVWWGTSAWCTPASGNTDLQLWWSDWGTWRNVSSSSNPGTQMDQVSYNHGPWWGNYKLCIIAVLDSVYTGQVSW